MDTEREALWDRCFSSDVGNQLGHIDMGGGHSMPKALGC